LASVITPCGGGTGVAVAGARVTNSTNQAVGNGESTAGWVTLAFDTETFDTNGMHDNAVNNSRLTAQRAAYYAFAGSVAFQSNGTGTRFGRVLVTPTVGSAVSISEFNIPAVQPSTGSFTTRVIVSALYHLAVGDYAQFQVYNSSGITLNILGDTASIPMWFAAWSV
jgi:hypothetical protein